MFHIEAKRRIKVAGEADVLVVGGGPAGISAAVSAARQGARTLLIECAGSLGGMSTSGLMSHFGGRVESKIFDEIIKRGTGSPIIDPELQKTAYIEMLSEAGADFLLYTFACGAIAKEGRVNGIVVESKSGRQAYKAKVTIDASGDGDIAAMAGVPFSSGRNDGKMQPVTLMFKVAGVDYQRAVFLSGFEDDAETPRGFVQTLAKKHLPPPAGHVLLYRTTLPGVVTCNMTNCTEIDGADVKSLTRGEITCRSQIKPIVEFLREFIPGYENCYLISSASQLGVRETRHLEGAYTLTAEDILAARRFDDWVVRGAHFNFDVHNLTGSGLDATGAQRHFNQPEPYTIPYGCLLPKKIDGLLFAGRNISGTHMAHSNYRVMPICAALGEAAGVAAALAASNGIEPRKVDVTEIQRRLA
ncbi:MAG: FAD-dependent oxidoreductase [Defluviitaleaceae bacterium]|nr:FAD-dependent oxidoreductase [Defluviitaleaceae bacterium]